MSVAKFFACSLLAVALAQPKPPENYLLAGCQQTNAKTLNCEALQISNVPLEIPSTIEKLMMKNNIINDNTGTELARCIDTTDPCGSGVLQAQNLANLPSTVTEVQIQGNGITGVADNAFLAVGGNILILRLFANELVEIQANALAGLTSLTTLYINNNINLAVIRSGAFDAFAATLSELFAKDNDALKVIEDDSVNALTFRPIFIDMTTAAGSLCAISPPKMVDGSLVDGTITCACAPDAGLYGGDDGYCEESSAPTVSPTASPVTSEPTTPAPTTLPPTTSAPTTAAPTTAAPTTLAPTSAPTAAEQNRGTEIPTTAAEQDRATGENGGENGGAGGAGGTGGAYGAMGSSSSSENGYGASAGGMGGSTGMGGGHTGMGGGAMGGGAMGGGAKAMGGKAKVGGGKSGSSSGGETGGATYGETGGEGGEGGGATGMGASGSSSEYGASAGETGGETGMSSNGGSKGGYTGASSEGGNSEVGYLSLGDRVNTLPVGDLASNVNLNGATSGKWTLVAASGGVVLAVGAMLVAYQRSSSKKRFTHLPFSESGTSFEREPLGDSGARNDYESFADIQPVLADE
eukprot:m.90034 g.90034  ORF g.90034 m.90034 type:complete len:579 (-) comp26358_c1_seq1:395-2131(-)